MNPTTARTVDIEVLAFAIRRQDKRFQELIRQLEGSDLALKTANKVIAEIEHDLRRVPTAR